MKKSVGFTRTSSNLEVGSSLTEPDLIRMENIFRIAQSAPLAVLGALLFVFAVHHNKYRNSFLVTEGVISRYRNTGACPSLAIPVASTQHFSTLTCGLTCGYSKIAVKKESPQVVKLTGIKDGTRYWFRTSESDHRCSLMFANVLFCS